MSTTDFAAQPAQPAQPAPTVRPRYLFVDLDGTLVQTDMLVESLLFQIKRSVWTFFRVIFWLFGGKADLKKKLATDFEFDPSLLPYNPAVLKYVDESRKAGVEVWLATASDERIADAVARHLKVFDGVLASGNGVNVSSTRKLDAIKQVVGQRSFEYIGNSADDVAIWQEAGVARCVRPDSTARAWFMRTQGQVAELTEDTPVRGMWKSFVRAARVHQWLKNILVFIPLLVSHRLGDVASAGAGVATFIAFGLCASSIYLVNDLLDLESDRLHPRKRKRPFASGELPLGVGFVAVPLLLLAGLLLAAVISPQLLAVLLVYLLLTSAYSFSFKRKMAVDVVLLAALYTIRIIAGAAAISVVPTFWLLAFSMFIFLGLALVKRYTELLALEEAGRDKVSGRNYLVADQYVVMAMGVSSCLLSVLVLALYINSPDVGSLYKTPYVLWALCPLLMFWVCRLWLMANRGLVQDDPVVFAVRDRVSQQTAVVAALIIVASTFG
ncbi:UbiA family prenyltransferase [Silvimonas iriomotensis]|uniref:Membrane protein n=1 Tax=Silvimonas iriomotensis TaxID=449662 RepID=A0ABQ2P7I5_9NEIS|nr:UbiA family prenyltransferase [Silvimonas iriomotensis]GGP20273.1 membrane protein [Silvimonas iriomotensis]